MKGKKAPEIADVLGLTHLNMQYPNFDVARQELSTDTEDGKMYGHVYRVLYIDVISYLSCNEHIYIFCWLTNMHTNLSFVDLI